MTLRKKFILITGGNGGIAKSVIQQYVKQYSQKIMNNETPKEGLGIIFTVRNDMIGKDLLQKAKSKVYCSTLSMNSNNQQENNYQPQPIMDTGKSNNGIELLPNLEVHYQLLDLMKGKKEIEQCVKRIKSEITPNIDILINNAAVMLKNDQTKSQTDKVRETLTVNFFSVVDLINNCKEELMKHEDGEKRILNLGARVCCLSQNKYLQAIPEFNEILRQKVFEPKNYKDVTMSSKDLIRLIQGLTAKPEYMGESYLSKIPKVFPDAPYLVSKIAIHALTRILAKELQNENVLVNALYPGHVRTKLGGEKAPILPDTAAQNIIEFLNRDFKQTYEELNGGLIADNKELPYL
ncbi:hypothetical protein ABK040_006275 [Willaertia magna]